MTICHGKTENRSSLLRLLQVLGSDANLLSGPKGSLASIKSCISPVQSLYFFASERALRENHALQKFQYQNVESQGQMSLRANGMGGHHPRTIPHPLVSSTRSSIGLVVCGSKQSSNESRLQSLRYLQIPWWRCLLSQPNHPKVELQGH